MLQMVRKFLFMGALMAMCSCDQFDIKGIVMPTGDGVDKRFEQSMEMNDEQTMYTCTIRFAADVARIDNVLLVDGRDVDEVRHLKTEPTLQYLPVDQIDNDN